MNEHPQDSPRPLRWEQHVPEAQRPGAELLKLLGSTLPSPLSEIAVARIRRRLDLERNVAQRSKRPRWILAIAFSAACLFFIEVAAAAVLAAWPGMRQRVATMGYGLLIPAEVRPPPKALPAPTVIPTPQPNLAPVPAASVPTSGGERAEGAMVVPASVPARSHRPAPLAKAMRGGGSSEDETAPLATALVQLHAKHDPEGALAIFEAYNFEHPNSALKGEAAVGQIEALLALDRDTEALALLEAMQRQGFLGVPRVSDLQLLHAELLGKLDRCEQAVPVLAEYVLPSTPGVQRERALIARASCRAKLKDLEGSREDLQTYLREFPRGRFAPKVLSTIGTAQ
jgi:hypothetical protein